MVAPRTNQSGKSISTFTNNAEMMKAARAGIKGAKKTSGTGAKSQLQRTGAPAKGSTTSARKAPAVVPGATGVTVGGAYFPMPRTSGVAYPARNAGNAPVPGGATHTPLPGMHNFGVPINNVRNSTGAPMPGGGKPSQVPPTTLPPSGTATLAPVDASHALRGTVAHSDSLPPLPSKYQMGAFCGAYGLPDPSAGGGLKKAATFKYQMPEWLAGKWQRSQATESQRTELPSGKELKTTGTTTASIEDIFGSYRDKNGQIWQIFSTAHATGVVDRGDYLDRHTVSKYNLEVLNDHSAIVEVQAYHLVINKKTQRIVQAYQDEELNTYTLLCDGRVRTDSSVKVFDAAGTATLLTRSSSGETRICKFDDLRLGQ